MVSSTTPYLLQNNQDVVQDVCENETHVHVIVYSCGSSAITKDLRFPGVKIYITSLPELPHFKDFISNFIPYGSTNLNLPNQQNYLQLLSRGPMLARDIVQRSEKYIRNPLRFFCLANRMRACSSGLLNPQLWFNIFVVVAWLLIRRTLEIFGIHLPGLAVASQNQQVPPAKSNKNRDSAVGQPQENDFVHLEAP